MVKFLSKLTQGEEPNEEPGFQSHKVRLKKLRQVRAQRQRRRTLIAVSCGGTLAAIGIIWFSFEQNLPNSGKLAAMTAVREETLTFKSADKSIFYQAGPATREALKFKQIPPQLAEAFLATEDRRFYQHHGIDPQGIGRALVTNLLSGSVAEGGSTITQQLSRISFLNQERSLTRKLREAVIALDIERNLSKEQILENYLNQVYLGEGAYGIADGAWVYFGKSVQELTLPEMAILAGLPAAPNAYSPLNDPEAARRRRNVVLQRMKSAGYITAAEAETAIQAPVETDQRQPQHLDNKAPYFTSYVEKQLPRVVSGKEIETGGLTVETTMNLKWQQAAQQAVQDATYYEGAAEGFSQAALVALDPRNGQIKAMVGGSDFYQSQFNRVTQAERQPGSTFKAFVYTAAIAAGFSPNDGYLDAPLTVDGYQPKNYSKEYRGWISMRQALTNSVNVVAVKTLIDVGFNPVIRLARQMGIDAKLQPYYSLALGSGEVTLLEMTSAYGTLAAQGVHAQPFGIARVLNREGEVLYDAKVQTKKVIDPGTTAIVTSMLEDVVNNGTGRAAQLGRPVAGKTGTSEEYRDLWFVGYIPQLVAGVWLGNDDNYPTGGSSGTAAYTWNAFMKRVAPDLPTQKFPPVPKLEGRKGSIKAEPVKPNSMYTGSVEKEEPENTYQQDSYSRGDSYQEGYADDGYSSDGYADEGYSSDGYN